MSKYAVILPNLKHIQHTFDTYEQAKSWMLSTKSSGFIAVIVAEIKVIAKTENVNHKILEFVEKLDKSAKPKTKDKER